MKTTLIYCEQNVCQSNINGQFLRRTFRKVGNVLLFVRDVLSIDIKCKQGNQCSTIYIQRQYYLKEQQHIYGEEIINISQLLCFWKRTLDNNSYSFSTSELDVQSETRLLWTSLTKSLVRHHVSPCSYVFLNGTHNYFEIMGPIDVFGLSEFWNMKYLLFEMFILNCVQIHSNSMTRGPANISRVVKITFKGYVMYFFF